jgi:hypothetical protein
LDQYKILRDLCAIREKFHGECWARAGCPSPLEVKVGLSALSGSKFTRLKHGSPSTRGCWGVCPALTGHTSCIGVRLCTKCPCTHTESIGSGYLPEPMFLMRGLGLLTWAYVFLVFFFSFRGFLWVYFERLFCPFYLDP